MTLSGSSDNSSLKPRESSYQPGDRVQIVGTMHDGKIGEVVDRDPIIHLWRHDDLNNDLGRVVAVKFDHWGLFAFADDELRLALGQKERNPDER